MKTLNLTFYTDPGHGWLAVNRADLDTLGIAHLISPYSYQRAGRVYLEEDCDMHEFLCAAQSEGWNVTYKETHQDPTPIRDFDHYRPGTPTTGQQPLTLN